MVKTIFSGIQPSGTIHIGNYLGAIKQWVDLQKGNKAYFCIVDLHAITVPYDNEHLPDHVLNAAAMYLACGIDPTKSTVFVQSHVPAHAELAWLLGTMTPVSQLTKMTQFKEKAKTISKTNIEATIKAAMEEYRKLSPQEKDIIHNQEKELAKELLKEVIASLGLLAYPVLQAADILLYQTDIVPVGEDQKQHIELTQEIARRFHNRFEKEGEKPVFTTPKPLLNKNTARIMSLTNPTKKMSKSDEPKSYIALTDEPDIIKKKIMSAVTETKPIFSFANSGPAVKNLLTIYQGFCEEEPSAVEAKFSGGGYQEFKEALANLLIEKLTPLQQAYKKERQPEELREILSQGAKKASEVANKTLAQVKKKMGL